MKTRITKHMMLAVLLAALFAHSQAQTDTIRGRYEHCLYYEWYDTCEAFFDSNVVRFYFEEDFAFYNLVLVNKVETAYPIAIKGLSTIIVPNADESDGVVPLHFYSTTGQYLPEYLLLIQQTDTGMLFLDSLRWDTLTPKVIHIPLNAYDTTAYHYGYLYEALFDKPICVDSTFYIGGTANSYNWANAHQEFYYHYKRANYGFVKQYFRDDWNYCSHYSLGGFHRGDFAPGFYNRNSECPWGPFFALADFHNVVVLTSDSTMGSVRGSGRYTDSIHIQITAVPEISYHFTHWNDGDTCNPRTVFVTQDTVFTAYFSASAPCQVSCSSGNPDLGYVRGGGSYYEGDRVVLTAIPNDRHIHFTRWNDGNTDNPRTVYLTQDTSFTAYFEWARVRQVLCESSNHSLGYTTGGGTYYEGDTAVLQAYAHTHEFPFHHWNDFDTANPRYVVVERDSSFIAFFAGQQDIAPVDEGAPRFTLTPNPARKQVTVQVESGKWRTESGERRAESGVFVYKAEMVLRDAAGHEVQRHTLRSPLTVLPVEKLPAGVYFATLYWNGSPASTQRLVLER